MNYEYIDFLELTQLAVGKSLKLALNHYFGTLRQTHESIGVPTVYLASSDAVLKRAFETRVNGGWPFVAYAPDLNANYTVSYERGNPHNMYRIGQYGGAMQGDLATYTKLKLLPVDVPYSFGFVTDKAAEINAFVSVWNILAHTSGLKFNEFFDSIGLSLPIGISLDPTVAVTINEDPEVPHRKAMATATVKTFVGMAQTVPSVLGTRYLADTRRELGETDQSPIFKDVSSL
jgi:hypothetical protein